MNLDLMADGDRTKWDYFTNMNAQAMMNYLSYLRDKSDLNRYLMKRR